MESITSAENVQKECAEEDINDTFIHNILCSQATKIIGHEQEVYITVLTSLYGVVALVSAIGLVLSCVAFQAHYLQRKKASSSNISGLVVSLACILNSIIAECKIGFYLHLYHNTFETRFSYLDIIFHSGMVTQNLLVTIQSFERYIIICKPHLKEGLTLSKMTFLLVLCLLLGILKGFLHRHTVLEYDRSEYVSEAVFSLISNDAITQDKMADKVYITAGIIANTVYYLFLSFAPCLLGIYLNWCTAKKLKKACVFVNTEERKEKFSRIMTLASLFTYMLVFYLLVDFIHQFNALYFMMSFITTTGWERYENNLIETTPQIHYSTKSLIDTLVFAVYFIQSFFISSILFWFKR